MNSEKLTPRLMTVCDLVPECGTCADIGCDHGQVSMWLVRHGKVNNMTAADLNEGPIERAKSAISRARLEDKISCVRTDGLDGIPPQDCVIIAGMGGDLIADIISRAEWTKNNGCTLVLQPMTAAYRLRKFLADNGYTVEKETYAAEREKLYVILRVKAGNYNVSDISELYISCAAESDPMADEYARRIVKKLKDELKGMCASDSPDEQVIAHRRAAVELIEKRFFDGK